MSYLDYCTIYAVKNCEQLDLNSHNRKWKALPDMREGRNWFNPCLFRGYVYLCGRGSRRIEAFSPQTDSFFPLPLQLPENTGCCVYVHNCLLVVHTDKYISQFAAGPTGQLIQHSQVCSLSSRFKFSNSLPVVAQDVFFIYQHQRIVSFSMKTGAQVRSLT